MEGTTPRVHRIRHTGLRLSVVAACLAALLSCSHAPLVPLVPTNRVVLAEFFTFSRCSYCPYAARALDSVVALAADSMIVIACHRRIMGDTLSPVGIESRSVLYGEGTGGEPATVFDGGPIIRTGDPGLNYPTFRDCWLGARSRLPLAQLVAIGGTAASLCSVALDVTGVDSTPPDTFRLFIVICEDSVRSYLPGNSDTIFNHVVRAFLPDTLGTPVALAARDTLRFVERTALRPFWNPSRLWAAAWVQDMASRRVLQAVRIPFH